MVSTPDDLMSNSPIYVGAVGTQKKRSAIKLLSHFLALLDVKQKNLFKYWKLIKQSASQSGQAVFYGLVFISGGFIQKSTNLLKGTL